MEFLINLDNSIFKLLNSSLKNPFFDYLMPLITEPHNWVIPVFVILLFLVMHGKLKEFHFIIMIGLVILVTDQVSSELLKKSIERLRPVNVLGSVYFFNEGFWQQTPEIVSKIWKSSYSMPSSHAANISALASLVFLYYKDFRLRITLAVFAFLICYSRIYIGVHYPSDVIAGSVLGIFLACSVNFLYIRFISRTPLYFKLFEHDVLPKRMIK